MSSFSIDAVKAVATGGGDNDSKVSKYVAFLDSLVAGNQPDQWQQFLVQGRRVLLRLMLGVLRVPLCTVTQDETPPVVSINVLTGAVAALAYDTVP